MPSKGHTKNYSAISAYIDEKRKYGTSLSCLPAKHYIHHKMYGALPDWEEFKDYQEIEGYKECMKAAREACIKHLTELWNQSREA